ncbi:uncharacterized protein LOC128883167 isoform X2 [Hylaeus volcanicus]|uniref:uncharacterized protein LOC128883167 isoform X2 n=1 Tax=Hylaeus volcanicus TaxID=313075 RepID=UPI0023B869E0|nr:uncharacterized protein LOC128883167 isoform X2 [Hylaeus volcanicus]
MPVVWESFMDPQPLYHGKNNQENLAINVQFVNAMRQSVSTTANSTFDPISQNDTFLTSIDSLPNTTRQSVSFSMSHDTVNVLSTESDKTNMETTDSLHNTLHINYSHDIYRNSSPTSPGISQPFFKSLLAYKNLCPNVSQQNFSSNLSSKSAQSLSPPSPLTEQSRSKLTPFHSIKTSLLNDGNPILSSLSYFSTQASDLQHSNPTNLPLYCFSNMSSCEQSLQEHDLLRSSTAESCVSKKNFKSNCETDVNQHFNNLIETQVKSTPLLPVFNLLNTAVWKGSLIGRGYSGTVHRGVGVRFSDSEKNIQTPQPVALKISDKKVMEFTRKTKLVTFSREFEVLKLLYKKGVPVPKPLNFSVNTDANGSVQTVLTMDFIEGLTLRDWINSQTNSVLYDKPTDRTLHPCNTPKEALERIDVALGLLDALQKLHEFGNFVDLKPRNIMVTRATSADKQASKWTSQWKVFLVDMGGVLLRSDIDATGKHNLCPPQSFQQETLLTRGVGDAQEARDIEISPLLHRQLLETTCSYISPEIAAAVMEYELLHNCLSNHFKQCTRDYFNDPKRHWNDLCRDVYKDLVKKLIKDGILQNTQNFINSQSASYGVRGNGNIFIGESSSMFSLGLIFVELFGGHRTGLTGFRHVPVISNWFSNPSSNKSTQDDCEFRIALEWNLPQFCINSNNLPTSATCMTFSSVNRIRQADELNVPMNSFKKKTCEKIVQCNENNSDDTEKRQHLSSFHDLFKLFNYPKEGLLSVANDRKNSFITSEPVTKLALLRETFQKFMFQFCQPVQSSSESQINQSIPQSMRLRNRKQENFVHHFFQNLTHQIVEFILNQCLKFKPSSRFSFTLLKESLDLLRCVVIALHEEAAFLS